MGDIISRQAAIDAMCDACKTVQAMCAHYPCGRYLAIEGTPSAQPKNMCVNLDVKKITTHKSDFSDLDEPSFAQPERKKGKWKRRIVDNGWNADWVCSECGYRFHYDFVNFNYCPDCGADMRGGEG